ncbi:MAG: ATP-binding protein [Ferruginibacter sp.]
MKKLVIALLFILGVISLSGQSSNVDSLQKELTVSREDTGRVMILQGLAAYYALQGLDSALFYGERGIQLSKKLNYIKGEALCFMRLAVYYRISGASAQGMHYALQALPLFEKLKDINDIILCNLLISWTLEDQEYPRMAVDYVLKVTPVAIKTKSEWLGYCYATLSNNYKFLNMLDSALVFGLQADTLMPYDDFNASSIGDIYLKMHRVTEAEKYLSRVIAASVSKGNLSSHAYNILSNLYSQKYMVDSALYFAKKALSKSENNKKDVAELAIAATMLKDLYQKKGLTDSMFFYMQIIVSAKDVLAGQERVNLISLLFNEQAQHQEMETRQLQYEKRVQIFFLLTLVTIFLLVSLVLYRHNRQKQKANVVLQQTLAKLKSTQSQLIQSEKMASLGELTAGIAHEIQNPLNFVNNFSEINTELIEELKSRKSTLKSEEQDELLNDIFQNNEKINHHGRRADAIVKGMLQHSRSTGGVKEPTDINALCDKYLHLSFLGARTKDKSFDATLKTDFDDSIGNITIIPQDIGRVLLNLYNNAFYAVNEKKKQSGEKYEPTVTVSTRLFIPPSGGPRGAEIKVRDNGNGIPQNIVDKIFQPFFTTKPTGQGTGLGLSLSYDIVKAHGGEIKVETKEGDYTEFTFTLPQSLQ